MAGDSRGPLLLYDKTNMRVFGFAGYSGSGKTTLIEKLIPRFVAQGLKVSLIKHAHHDFDVDKPGKDSYRHRAAGCSEVLISYGKRWALMHELRDEPPPSLDEQVALLSPCDLVLVEGLKHAPIPKLEVHRPALGKPLLQPETESIVAVACDARLALSVPLLPLSDDAAVAGFILRYLGLVHE